MPWPPRFRTSDAPANALQEAPKRNADVSGAEWDRRWLLAQWGTERTGRTVDCALGSQMPGEARTARARRQTPLAKVDAGRVARSTARLAARCLEKRAPPELGDRPLWLKWTRDGSPSSVEGAALEMP